MAEYPTGYEYPSGGFPKDLTWDEFLALPYELRNASLVDGEVVVNRPNAQHEWIVRNLILVFADWTRAAPDRGQVSTQQAVKINDRRGYQPDFAWYPQELCAPKGEKRKFSGLPGLVVEVLSPSTRAYDLVRKRRDYEAIGIGEVWFVEQDVDRYGIVACQRQDADAGFGDTEFKVGDRLASRLLDGFDLDVADVFRDD